MPTRQDLAHLECCPLYDRCLHEREMSEVREGLYNSGMRSFRSQAVAAAWLFVGVYSAFSQGAADGWSRQVVAQGPVRIENLLKGEGVPVLMHPGARRPAHDLEPLGDRVAATGYTVVRINPRGTGASEGSTEGITTKAFSSDVWMVADKLGFRH